MLLNCIVGLTIEEAGLCWFDFFSIGHFCFGLATFLIFSLFYTIPKKNGKIPIFSLLFVFILTLIVLIGWEIVENTIVIDLGLKFEGRPDNWNNIITDIAIGIIGALINWLAAHEIIDNLAGKGISWYYISGTIAFILWLVFFFILRYFTLYYTGMM